MFGLLHLDNLNWVRPPNKIGEYAELGDVNRDKVKEDELEFAKVSVIIIIVSIVSIMIIVCIINMIIMAGSGEQSR